MIPQDELIVSAAWVTELLQARGFEDYWPVSEPVEQEKILFRVQDYLAASYNGRWATEWVEPPMEVSVAIAYLALAEARRPGLLSEVITPGRVLTAKSLDGASETYGQDVIASLKSRVDPYLGVAHRNLSRQLRRQFTQTIRV